MRLLLLAAFGVALVMGTACASQRGASRDAPVRDSPELVACSVRGAQMLYPSAYLFGSAARGAVIGRSRGAVVRLDLSEIGIGANALTRAEVRVPANGPAFVLHAFLELRELELYARRELPIVAGHVWIANGSNVRLVRGGSAGRPRVVASYGAFDELATDVACDALGLDPSIESATPRPPRRASPEHLMHIARAGAALYDERGGALLDLGRQGEGTTVEVTGARDTLRRVRYDDGVRIDAWMRASDLVAGEGPDCDDCHGGIRDTNDVCPDSGLPADDSGCPEVDTRRHHRRDNIFEVEFLS